MTPPINIHAIKTHEILINTLAPGPYRVVTKVIDIGSGGMGGRVDSSPLRMSELMSSRVVVHYELNRNREMLQGLTNWRSLGTDKHAQLSLNEYRSFRS